MARSSDMYGVEKIVLTDITDHEVTGEEDVTYRFKDKKIIASLKTGKDEDYSGKFIDAKVIVKNTKSGEKVFEIFYPAYSEVDEDNWLFEDSNKIVAIDKNDPSKIDDLTDLLKKDTFFLKKTVFTDIREDTVKFTVSKQETTSIYTENDRQAPYRVFSTSGDAPKIDFAVYASFEELAELMGGTATKTSYTPPNDIIDIYKKVQIFTRETDKEKNQMILTIPFASIQTGIEGSLKYNDLGYVEVTATAMKKKESDVPYTLEIIKKGTHIITPSNITGTSTGTTPDAGTITGTTPDAATSTGTTPDAATSTGTTT